MTMDAWGNDAGRLGMWSFGNYGFQNR